MRFLMIAPVLALAACVTAEPPVQPGPELLDSCGASKLSYLVGTPLSTFDTSTHKGPVRVLAPDSIMTMDMLPSRLNIYHNKAGTIEKLTCG